MSRLLDQLLFFRKNVDTFSGQWGVVTQESRQWEDGYRKRWDFDKVVRSTHGVNCTGSCSWQVYVKSGIVMYETQQTDYPRTRAGIPNHEPRGCQRGASCSWYIYHDGRLRYPMVRRALLELWHEARRNAPDAVEAWRHLVDDPEKRAAWVASRGKGGFIRSTWEEVNELIAAAHVHTAKTWGPDRICGFAPIPAYSMVSYGAGTRYLSLIGGTCISFYDWYADLPPSSPQTWGEQTDVPESAAWYGAGFLILWGANVAQTRSPDAHFFAETRYHGTRSVVVTPDYSDTSKFADLWMHPRQGTDAALAMAMGHVIFQEFHVDRPQPYLLDYCRRYTDLPMLVRLERQGTYWVPGRYLRAADFPDTLGQAHQPEWKPVALDEESDRLVVPPGSAGFRWGEDGHWNLEATDARTGNAVTLALTQLGRHDAVLAVGYPYFGGSRNTNDFFGRTNHPEVLLRNVPARKLQLADGEAMVASVYDLMLGSYGVNRGLGGPHEAASLDDDVPYTPAWQESITGVPRAEVIAVAREFAETAVKTQGKCMILLGAATNHWYHGDMTYRAIIAMLIGCGTVGRPNGGFAHYVGQECIRPEEGWLTFSFALDWQKPPRQVPGTSYFYAHSNQWRYETVSVESLLSPTAQPGDWSGSLIDYNARAERMGWLGTSPTFDSRNSLDIARASEASGESADDYVARRLKSGELKLACFDPDAPGNWPRAMMVWRSNLLGASGKGHEYFLRHLVGARNHGVQGAEIPGESPLRPEEVVWRETAPEGKLDLLVTIDFRMSSTALYSDVVLPAATWYEKNDLSTTDMHPFVHPLGEAISPVWESRSDWEIYKGLAKAFDEQCAGHLAPCKDLVIAPLAHDSPSELAQPFDVCDWGRGETEPIPGKTMGRVVLVERDYGNIYRRLTALGPAVKEAVEGKGIEWSGAEEYARLKTINGIVDEAGVAAGAPRIESDIDAIETILALASATNGQVSLRAFHALSEKTGRDHSHYVGDHATARMRYRDIVAQPRKAITTPTWSGVMNEESSYSAFQQNIDDLIPWRTLSGRQQLYADHGWMRAFGEAFPSYKPPVDLQSIESIMQAMDNGNPQLVLNFVTPHQKWGIHSSYTDNLLMLTLARGGPILWVSEGDARRAGIQDNDWVEAYNTNGALAARAVVASRIPEGLAMMYHAQDKTVNTPAAETSRRRGLHNSVTRVVPKPTHMIGGYAHLAYGFNYYGPIGANRDTLIVLRKMKRVDWLDGTPAQVFACKELPA